MDDQRTYRIANRRYSRSADIFWASAMLSWLIFQVGWWVGLWKP